MALVGPKNSTRPFDSRPVMFQPATIRHVESLNTGAGLSWEFHIMVLEMESKTLGVLCKFLATEAF